MMKKIASLLLSGALACSLLPAALAAETQPASPAPTVQAATDPAGSVSFANLRTRMQQNNPSIQFCLETLAAANAMDRETAYKDLQEKMNDLNDAAFAMIAHSSASIQTVLSQFSTLSDEDGTLRAALNAVGEAAAAKAYYQVQAENLTSAASALEDQLDNLKAENYDKTITDTNKRVQANINQILYAGETMYLSLLSAQIQLDSLNQTLAGTNRTLEEMQLRCQLGQISKLTLAQTENAQSTLTSSAAKLERTISSLKASLQNMLGEPLTGSFDLLVSLPVVSQAQLDALSYEKDLAAAKAKSYTIFAADRALSDAKDDWTDAQKDYGSSSYKYKMAQHTYQAAVYTHDAALENFTLSFRTLYQAIPTARITLSAAQDTLAYQQKSFAATQLKYQRGLISHRALLTAQDAVSSAQRDVTSAQLNLVSAYHTYHWAVEDGVVNASAT